jgi:hypothetical protein
MTIIEGPDTYQCPSCGKEHPVWKVVSTNNFSDPPASEPETVDCPCGCSFAWRSLTPIRRAVSLSERRRRVQCGLRRRPRLARDFESEWFEQDFSRAGVEMWSAARELEWESGWRVGEIRRDPAGRADWLVTGYKFPGGAAETIAVDVVEATDPVAMAARDRMSALMPPLEVIEQLSSEEARRLLETLQFELAHPSYTPERMAELLMAAAISRPTAARPSGVKKHVLVIVAQDTDFKSEIVCAATLPIIPPFDEMYVIMPQWQERDRYPVYELPGCRGRP